MSTITKAPKIAVFGLGTAGCHMIDVFAKSKIDKQVRLIAVDKRLMVLHLEMQMSR